MEPVLLCLLGYQSWKLLIKPINKGQHLLHIGVSISVNFVDETIDELSFCFDIRFDLSEKLYI
jgi:hypothetical protein